MCVNIIQKHRVTSIKNINILCISIVCWKKMKELNGCRSNNSVKKHKTKPKKQKSSFKYFVKNSWPKVMISRDNVIYKKTTGNAQSSSELRAEEERIDYGVKKSNCDENDANFEEGHSVCLISSSSEIQESLDVCETFVNTEETLEPVDEPIGKDNFNCTSKESGVPKGDDCPVPVFVDLTTEKKSRWKHSILKRYRNVKKNVLNEKKSGSGNCIVENVLDSSSKSNCNRVEGPATALRSHGSYLIPMQPNRCLPIRPAPSVPTRSFQKRFSPVLILPKFITQHTIEVEPVKSPSTSSSDEILKGADLNSETRIILNESVNSMDYVIPQISNVKTLAMVKRRRNNDVEHEKDHFSIQECRKRRRSEEADSSQNKVENSIDDFITDYGPNVNGQMQSRCTDKYNVVVSTTKEDTGNKLVPPLRLKKIARTKSTEATDSQVTAASEQETNYRIIRDKPPEPSSSPTSSTNTDDMFYETETDLASLNTDSRKLKYRRNKLKEKLNELRSKAFELSKQMANEPDSQQNTSLRQVMNRYEKQIENISKLHSKLSAAMPSTEETINTDDNNSLDNECINMNLIKNDDESTANNCSVSSPEPPKLSPRPPICYDDTTQEIPNSPPVLPKACLATSSSQDAIEELKVSETKPWLMDVDLMKPFPIRDSVQSDIVNENISSFETLVENIQEQSNTTSIDKNNPDFCINEILLSTSSEMSDLSENKLSAWEETNESSKLINEFPYNDIIQKSEKIKSQNFFNNGPAIKSLNADLRMDLTQGNETFTSDKQISSLEENALQIDSCESNQPDSAYSNMNGDTTNLQNVTSSTSQLTQFNVSPTVLNPRYPKLEQSYKTEDEPNDSKPKPDNPLITEQFPSLSNWLTRMSRRQTSKVKSKLKSTGNLPFVTIDDKRMRTGESVAPRIGSNNNNDMTNAAPQGIERWPYQRLLQHTSTPMTLSQHVATVPPLRPATYSAVPVTQFYLNNYAIDPYNGPALNYHPAIFPYGSYPYQSRLHSNTAPGYHFSMPEGLRPMQQIDKRFPLTGQEPVIRYPPPAINTLQHPNNLEFDRLRGSSNVSNISTATCLPSLFPSASSSYQALRRDSSVDYPTSNQFSGNRMDVVAAAAAAAVVAAASIDRQYDTLGYNRTDMLPTSGIANTIDERLSDTSSSNKSTINPSNSFNQMQDNSEEIQNNMKYQKMLNLPFDRLTTKVTGDFTQTNSMDNHPVASMAPTSYQMLLNPSYSHLSRNASESEARNASTSHFGKMARNLNNLRGLKCSNCGKNRPKFKCFGCEMAFYCDERCQEKHWYIHVKVCSKVMPKLKKLIN